MSEAKSALREAVETLRDEIARMEKPAVWTNQVAAKLDAILAAHPDAPAEPRRCQQCGGSGYENRMAEPARICTRCHKAGVEPDAPAATPQAARREALDEALKVAVRFWCDGQAAMAAAIERLRDAPPAPQAHARGEE